MEEKHVSGLSRERLNLLAAAIKKDVELNKYDGGAVLVARGGEIGLQEAIGFAERASRRPCHLNDVFHLMSVTKAFTDVILLSQIERGDLALTTRVTDVIPEFKSSFKDQVIVFHLLTHTAGAPPVMFLVEDRLIGNHQAEIEAACEMGLISAPGERVDYSGTWGHTILGEIMRRVDGGKRSLRDIYQDELFGPLKMKDTAMGLRRDLIPRLVPMVGCGGAPVFRPLNQNKSVLNEDSEIPGWGCVSTLPDLFRFTEMLRRGGELDGMRILSPTTIKLATTIHTGNKINEALYPIFSAHGWPPFPANIGLDLIIRGEGINGLCSLGTLTSPHTFGKFGAGSTGFWIDPECDVTFIFLSVGLLDEYYNFMRFQRLADMAMAAVI